MGGADEYDRLHVQATLDGSIVIIALPAIFRGIGLDPLAPGSIFYLLWMIMGYRLVQAVAVVSLGRLGDMYGRVKIYNAGFVVFTLASIMLSFDPYHAGAGAMWLIGWRFPQAIGRARAGTRKRLCPIQKDHHWRPSGNAHHLAVSA